MRTLWMLVALIALSVGLLHAQAKPGKTVALSESFEGDVEAWKLDQELVEGDGVARTGGKCLHGKIEGPNKALFARRTLTLSTQAIYRLEVWIRGTNGTKLAVWLIKGQQRQNIGQFQNTPRRWVRRESAFTPLEDGEWTLEFVAPSSHGAPDGEMWVDDVKVTETRLPATINLTEGEGVSDYPAVAVAPSGEVHAAWVRADEQGDQLRLARLERDGQGKWSAAQTWDLADPSRAYLMEPVIAAGPGATVLVAPAEWKGGNWELFSVEIGAEGPGRVARLTTTESTEVKPAIAWAGQTLWVAWEGNAGGVRRVYAAQWADGKLGEPIVLSAADVSSYTPAIAADGQGRVWVAYDSFRDSRYDLWVAHFDGTKWQPERRITDDDWIDHRPGLASAKDGLWIAWEQGVCAPRLEAGKEAPAISTYRTNAYRAMRVRVARLGPDGLQEPANLNLPMWTERPELAVDPEGRVWLAVRGYRERVGWDVFAYCLAGTEPIEGVQLTSTPGWSGRAALGAAGDEMLLVAQAGRATPAFANVDASTAHASDVHLMGVSRADAPPPGPLSLRAFDPGLAELGFAAMRDRFAEERPTPSIEYEGQNLLLLYGDLHDHTEISQCNRRGDLTPDDNYAHNRDIHRLDFAAVTDHGYNITPAIWRLTGKTARYNHDPGRFVTFLGEEWTSTNEKKSPEHPEGYYGHRNLIFADPYFPRWFNARDDGTPAQIWADLRKDNANFVQIPHQLADTGNVPTDWNFTDEVAQPVAEIFQARESYEYEGSPRQAKNTISGHFIQDAWAKGIVIGVIASPDHGGGKGKACIYAPERTREAILDAIRARHTYGTTCAKIFLDFRVNGRLMGEKLPGHEGKPVTIQVRAEGAGDIERIDICRNNEFVFTREIGGPAAEFEYKDEDPPAGPTYYYARVVQVDQELAWSSPVWLGAE